jgi:hypothetical protein
MAIHEKPTRIPKHGLQQVGWSKVTELVKVAWRDGERFDCATWWQKAKEMAKKVASTPWSGTRPAKKRNFGKLSISKFTRASYR